MIIPRIALLLIPALLVPLSHAKSPLLEEVVAGAEANISKIDKGSATYSVAHTLTRPSGNMADNSYEVAMRFKDQSCRWDMPDAHYVLDERNFLAFEPKGLKGKIEPFNYSVLVAHRNKASVTPWNFHPRTLGFSIGPASKKQTSPANIAEYIRDFPDRDGFEIEAIKENGLIKIVAMTPSSEHDFWIDPKQGYALVKHWGYAQKTPDLPFIENETSYRREGTAYVVAKHKMIHRAWNQGRASSTRSMKRRST